MFMSFSLFRHARWLIERRRDAGPIDRPAADARGSLPVGALFRLREGVRYDVLRLPDSGYRSTVDTQKP
jgi:hypothetical protein